MVSRNRPPPFPLQADRVVPEFWAIFRTSVRVSQPATAEWSARPAVGDYGLASDPKFRAWKATLARGRGSVFLIPWHDPR